MEIRNYEEAVKHYEIAAEAGLSDAHYHLGRLYSEMCGVKLNVDLALKHFEAAVAKNHGGACYFLGDLFGTGLLVPKDKSKAEQLFDKAKAILEDDVKQGDAESLTLLGLLYSDSGGYLEDKVKAKELLEQAAELGNPFAMFYLGSLYMLGQVVDQDSIKAKEFFEQAADLGCIKAFAGLGYLCQSRKDVPVDYEKLREYFEKAAAFGDACSIKLLGKMYYQGKGLPCDYTKAKELFEQAIVLGDRSAFSELGSMYRNGDGVEQDLAKAKEFYELALEFKSESAMFNLGNMYRDGLGVPQDFAKAKELYEQAVALDSASAINNLANIYLHGQGVPKDLSKAKKLFEQAADLGVDVAISNLANMYREGSGVAKDLSKAKELFERAIALGNTTAIINLGVLYQDSNLEGKNYLKAKECYDRAFDSGRIEAIEYIATLYKNWFRVPNNKHQLFCMILSDLKKPKLNEALLADAKLAKEPIFAAAAGVHSFNNGQYDDAFNRLKNAKYQEAVEVQFDLGVMLDQGLGTEQDQKRAQSCLFVAADNGYVEAMSYLGQKFSLEHDVVPAFELYQKAAATNDSLGNFAVGLAYLMGCMVKPDQAQTLSYLEKSVAQSNCAVAAFVLGQMAVEDCLAGNKSAVDLALGHFSQSLAILSNHSEPAYLANLSANRLESQLVEAWSGFAQKLKSAQDSDSPTGLNLLSLIDKLQSFDEVAAAYQKGLYYENLANSQQDGAQSNLELAISCFKQAAESSAYPSFDYRNLYRLKSLLKLCRFYSDQQLSAVIPEALPFYQQALAEGLVEAGVALGNWYRSQVDLTQAVKAYELAAQGGIAPAQLILGQIYHSEPEFLDQAKARELLDSALEFGLVEAAFPLAEIYEQGQGCSVDVERAFTLYLQSANAGEAEAQFRVGRCYLQGQGTETSAQKALSWLEQAAAQNHPQAVFTLAQLYEAGQDVDLNLDKAASLYQQAADLGWSEAASALAKLQLASGGQGENTQEILQQLKNSGDKATVLNFHLEQLAKADAESTSEETEQKNKAELERALIGIKELADEGMLEAQIAVAQFYDAQQAKQKDDVAAQLEQAAQAQSYHSLAAEQGYVPSFFVVADKALGQQDYDSAVEWYTKITDESKKAMSKLPQGYTSEEDWHIALAQAYFALGQICEQGLGMAADCKKAGDWYSKASELGNIEARLALALLYLNGGSGFKADERQAITLLNKLAKRKIAAGQCELGKAYLAGQGVKPDPKQAFTLIKAAAEQKYPEAMAKLSELYAKGTGVAANPKLAQSWLNKAKVAGLSV